MKRLLVAVCIIAFMVSGCAPKKSEEARKETIQTESVGPVCLTDDPYIYLRVAYTTENGFVGFVVREPGSHIRDGKEIHVVFKEDTEVFVPIDENSSRLFAATEAVYEPGMLIEVQFTSLNWVEDTIYPELMYIQRDDVPWWEKEEAATAAQMPWENAEVTDFGVRLLRESMDAGKNTLISPLSVLAALSMTANGAEGDTLTQMERVLGQRKDALNAWYKYDVGKTGDVLHLANAVFIQDDPELTVSEDFIRAVEQYYETDILVTAFNEQTLVDINQYVEDNTNGMIRDILDRIPREAVMYLVNALAFEAMWKEPYNEYSVQERIFTTEDGREQTVKLMYAEENDAYVEDNLFTGFLKGYEGGRYAFLALLPKEGVSVEEVADSLSGDALAGLVNSPWEGKVLTAMPKFQTEFDVEMSEVLKSMGMTDAFDPYKADFSGLATYNGGNIFINRVLHKSFISVGEQGTRAGAATVIEAAAESAMEPEKIKEVILNRPFLYMIWDMEACQPIFMGTFMDAQAEGTSVPADDPDIFYSPAEDPCLMEG